MKELTQEEMKLISGGAPPPQPQFGPDLIARLILGALFFDFGSESRGVTWGGPGGNGGAGGNAGLT